MNGLGEELSAWLRARRHAVPRWMIERATGRRLAGDWRGACAAARVDVEFDPDDVACSHGTEVAEALVGDLRRLAPDLLRWNLPRAWFGSATLAPRRAVVLGEYGGATLHALTPETFEEAQRVRLRFGPLPEIRSARGYRQTVTRDDWSGHRYLWDAHRSGELLSRWGGRRAPFFRADGTPLTGDELPAADPGPDDPAALTEWLTLLRERGDFTGMFAAAGLADLLDAAGGTSDGLWRVRRSPLDLVALAREIEALRDRGMDEAHLEYHHGRYVLRTDPLSLRYDVSPRLMRWRLPLLAWHLPPDLLLLRAGAITPERLHPLVRGALFPERPPADGPVGPPDPEPPAPVRVRCRDGEWHWVRMRGGRLEMPHGEEERRRERAVRAFGGGVAGCFAVAETLESDRGRLPRRLRDQVRELRLRFRHGDAPGVLRMLDLGVSPHLRTAGRRTLLHLLHLVDHEELLPRLLDAGLDVNAEDHTGLTPLYLAVAEGGSERYVRALLEAGARTDTVGAHGRTLAMLIRHCARSDLWFLHEHPSPPRTGREPF